MKIGHKKSGERRGGWGRGGGGGGGEVGERERGEEVFPELNFSVAVGCLRGVRRFLEEGDVGYLGELEVCIFSIFLLFIFMWGELISKLT